MSDRNAPVPQGTSDVAPGWLSDYQDDSARVVAHLQRLNLASLIQGMSPPDLKDEFGEGAAVLRPANEPLFLKGEVAHFIVLHFRENFIVWNDRNDMRPDIPNIFDRSVDPASELADLCRNLHEETYDKEFTRRWVEHKEFFCARWAPGTPEHLGPFGLSLSRTGWKKGVALGDMIARRSQRNGNAPMWAMVHTMGSFLDSNAKGQRWFNWEFKEPTDPGMTWIDNASAETVKALHIKVRDEVSGGKTDIDVEADSGGTSETKGEVKDSNDTGGSPF